MNINELTFQVKRQVTEEELVPLVDVIASTSIDEEQLMALSETLNLPVEHFYYEENKFPSVFYYNYPVYTDIHTVDSTDASYMDYYRKRIAHQHSLYEEKDYQMFLFATEGPCQTLIFKRLFNELPKSEQYDLLRYFYTNQDHGHTQLSQDIWKEALKNRPDDYSFTLPYESDSYTIYRGGGSKSAPLDKTLSWTLDLTTALKFAYRSNDGTVLYQATVKRDDISDYFDDRNEQEVIVRPEAIRDCVLVEQRDAMSFYVELLDNKLIDEFNYYRNTFVKQEHFKIDSSLHGKAHTGRVLLHALALSHIENLSDEDRAVMANVAIYHDIGRTTDGVDPYHGEVSVDQLDKLGVNLVGINCQKPDKGEPYALSNLSDEDETLVRTIIAHHAKPDKEGLSNPDTSKFSPELTDRYQRLYLLFKDADGLDRVRLSDIDMSYIRTESATSLLVFALKILSTLK